MLKLTPAAWRADPILLALVHCFYDYENLILATGIINIQPTNIVTITGGRSICTTQAAYSYSSIRIKYVVDLNPRNATTQG